MFYIGLTISVFVGLVLFLISKKKIETKKDNVSEKLLRELKEKFKKIKKIVREELNEDIKETKNFFNNKK